jgi:hypothetical protein
MTIADTIPDAAEAAADELVKACNDRVALTKELHGVIGQAFGTIRSPERSPMAKSAAWRVVHAGIAAFGELHLPDAISLPEVRQGMVIAGLCWYAALWAMCGENSALPMAPEAFQANGRTVH